MPISQHILGAGLITLGACTFDGGTDRPGNTSLLPDAAARPDAEPADAGPPGLHLLLSEVRTIVTGTEFIEIYNPTAETISLADYYLADNADYALLPAVVGTGPKPDVAVSDFIVRFPAAASIESKEALIIGIDPDAFYIFDTDPDFYVNTGASFGTGMLPAFAGSIGNLVSLTDTGEGIALFSWDGTSDLVTDIDLLNAGAMTSEDNRLANKAGLAVDGPDSDTVATAYRPDQAMESFSDALELRQSYTRVAHEAGAETQDGVGNGMHGHDESSESVDSWRVEEASPGVVGF